MKLSELKAYLDSIKPDESNPDLDITFWVERGKIAESRELETELFVEFQPDPGPPMEQNRVCSTVSSCRAKAGDYSLPLQIVNFYNVE